MRWRSLPGEEEYVSWSAGAPAARASTCFHFKRHMSMTEEPGRESECRRLSAMKDSNRLLMERVAKSSILSYSGSAATGLIDAAGALPATHRTTSIPASLVLILPGCTQDSAALPQVSDQR